MKILLKVKMICLSIAILVGGQTFAQKKRSTTSTSKKSISTQKKTNQNSIKKKEISNHQTDKIVVKRSNSDQASLHNKNQQKVTNKLVFGIRAGGNLANVLGVDDNRNMGSILAFHGSLLGKYNLINKVFVQTEVGYNLLGGKGNYIQSGDKMRSYMHNISVPILVQYQVSPSIYIETGPQIDFCLKMIEKTDENTYDMDISKKAVSSEWVIGAGYSFTKNVIANIRYGHSISSPIKDSGNGNVSHFRHSVFQFGFIYLINK